MTEATREYWKSLGVLIGVVTAVTFALNLWLPRYFSVSDQERAALQAQFRELRLAQDLARDAAHQNQMKTNEVIQELRYFKAQLDEVRERQSHVLQTLPKLDRQQILLEQQLRQLEQNGVLLRDLHRIQRREPVPPPFPPQE
jgi:hypothetical protein